MGVFGKSLNFKRKIEKGEGDMKKKLTGILLLLLFIALPFAGTGKSESTGTRCHAYVVMDAGSGEVLFGQDAK